MEYMDPWPYQELLRSAPRYVKRDGTGRVCILYSAFYRTSFHRRAFGLPPLESDGHMVFRFRCGDDMSVKGVNRGCYHPRFALWKRLFADFPNCMACMSE